MVFGTQETPGGISETLLGQQRPSGMTMLPSVHGGQETPGILLYSSPEKPQLTVGETEVSAPSGGLCILS